MAMRVLVTGAAGHLGTAVCKALAEGGLDLRPTDRVYSSDLPAPLKVADLLDSGAVYPLMEGCEAVVHLANHPRPLSHVPPQQLYSENVTMDMNVFQAAADLGVRRIVFSSSVQVVSGDREMDELEKPSCLAYLPMDGDLPTCARNTYALSKEAAEQQLRYFAALDAKASCTSARFPALISPWHMQWMRRAGRRPGPWHAGNPDEGGAYLTVDDAGALVLAVLLRQGPGYHQLLPAARDNFLGMDAREMVERFYKGVPLRKPFTSERSVVDLSPITEQLGWAPEDARLFEPR
jgi:nucleoside-diphosphate-sugar epimerase